jgi:hypothetical protein
MSASETPVWFCGFFVLVVGFFFSIGGGRAACFLFCLFCLFGVFCCRWGRGGDRDVSASGCVWPMGLRLRERERTARAGGGWGERARRRARGRRRRSAREEGGGGDSALLNSQTTPPSLSLSFLPKAPARSGLSSLPPARDDSACVRGGAAFGGWERREKEERKGERAFWSKWVLLQREGERRKQSHSRRSLSLSLSVCVYAVNCIYAPTSLKRDSASSSDVRPRSVVTAAGDIVQKTWERGEENKGGASGFLVELFCSAAAWARGCWCRREDKEADAC